MLDKKQKQKIMKDDGYEYELLSRLKIEDKFIKLFTEKFWFSNSQYDKNYGVFKKNKKAISIDDFIKILRKSLE